MLGGTQKSLFETEPSSDSRLVELRKLGLNRVAFNVTKTGLSQGDPDVLKYMFYGTHNLEIGSEIASIANGGEISSMCLAAGGLKKGDAHRLSDSKIPDDFLRLVRYMNKCSYGYRDGRFASLASKLKDKECFNSGPWEQKERFGLLKQSIGEKFVKSFFSPYKFSDKENSYIRDFHDRGDKKFYVDAIYEKFKFLNEEADKLLKIIL